MSVFGTLDVQEFLDRHWQNAPLLVRGAIPDIVGRVDGDTLAALSLEPDVESRLVHAAPGGWVPNWVFNFVSKTLPFKAIANLRDYFAADGQVDSVAWLKKRAELPAFVTVEPLAAKTPAPWPAPDGGGAGASAAGR